MPINNEWVKKMWHIRIVEYYAALKKEALLHGITWMKLEEIMLSEVSHKRAHCVIPLIPSM